MMYQSRYCYFLLVLFAFVTLTGFIFRTESIPRRSNGGDAEDGWLNLKELWREVKTEKELRRLKSAPNQPDSRDTATSSAHRTMQAESLYTSAHRGANVEQIQTRRPTMREMGVTNHHIFDHADGSDAHVDPASKKSINSGKIFSLVQNNSKRDETVTTMPKQSTPNQLKYREKSKSTIASTTSPRTHKEIFLFCRKKFPSNSNQCTSNLLDINEAIRRLHICLSTANLTDYFIDQDIMLKAKSNVEVLINALCTLLSRVSIRLDKDCWEMDLYMNFCKSTTQGIIIEGSLNGFPFLAPLNHFRLSVINAILAEKFYKESTTVCLPKLFIAGFPKCGSSYLYCLITKLISMSNQTYKVGEFEKEPHFWVSEGPFVNHRFPQQSFDLAGYLFNFLPAVESKLNNRYSFPIDGSPNLMFQWPRFSYTEDIENYCLLPAVLPQILPHSKYIVIMRNPADMLYSAFWYSCSTFGIELSEKELAEAPFIFHNKVIKKIKIFEECSRSYPVDKCMTNLYPPILGKVHGNSSQCTRVRLEVGFYYLYVRRWLSVVPRKQFLFLTSEELKRDIKKVTNDISNFLHLGIEINAKKNLKTLLDMKHGASSNYAHSTSCNNVQSIYDYHHDTSLKMLDYTRKILDNFFHGFNRKLANLLGDNIFLFNTV